MLHDDVVKVIVDASGGEMAAADICVNGCYFTPIAIEGGAVLFGWIQCSATMDVRLSQAMSLCWSISAHSFEG